MIDHEKMIPVTLDNFQFKIYDLDKTEEIESLVWSIYELCLNEINKDKENLGVPGLINTVTMKLTRLIGNRIKKKKNRIILESFMVQKWEFWDETWEIWQRVCDYIQKKIHQLVVFIIEINGEEMDDEEFEEKIQIEASLLELFFNCSGKLVLEDLKNRIAREIDRRSWVDFSQKMKESLERFIEIQNWPHQMTDRERVELKKAIQCFVENMRKKWLQEQYEDVLWIVSYRKFLEFFLQEIRRMPASNIIHVDLQTFLDGNK